jgi:hypothetical protein
MNDITMLDEKAMIEKLLARMRARKPGIPAGQVKKLIENIGKEIERTGCLSKEYVDQLLRQLKNGEL